MLSSTPRGRMCLNSTHLFHFFADPQDSLVYTERRCPPLY